uniref:Ig-like domain-containing protein n=1 Tax=Anabas testudineus TaxID=64144 RepID=A0AAQ6IC44_ANATE
SCLTYETSHLCICVIVHHILLSETPSPTLSALVDIDPLSTDVKSVVLKGESHIEKVELVNPVNLELQCKWDGTENNLQTITGYWTKDGSEIENSRVTVQLEDEQYNLKQKFSILNETNLGNYSCVFGNEAKINFILSVPQVSPKRDKPLIGYLRDYVVIECKVEDNQPEPDSWSWSKKNGTDKEIIYTRLEPLKYEIKTKERKTRLVVHNLTEADAGLYFCGAVYPIGTSHNNIELKVITLWEPLKPFLAILVEVCVLVAAILLYERSQSKKNCATENGPNPDQTNTLTQEENNEREGNSSVRQRNV